MDCDYDPKAAAKQELIENTKGRKKRKRKSLFAKAVSQPKPVFDPNDKSYEEYLDEYYKLDCEDIIGDIPCKFKYRKVAPNDFGLTVEEILMAKDRELNKWCSLKKALQHRPDHVEKYDQIAYVKKGKNIELKKKILPSLFESEENDEGEKIEETKQIIGKKKKKGKKIRCKKGVIEPEEDEKSESIEQQQKENEEFINGHMEKKKKKKKQTQVEASENTKDHKVVDIKDTASENKQNKKKKRKKKNKKAQSNNSAVENNEA